jgi:hypothetical protein
MSQQLCQGHLPLLTPPMHPYVQALSLGCNHAVLLLLLLLQVEA